MESSQNVDYRENNWSSSEEVDPLWRRYIHMMEQHAIKQERLLERLVEQQEIIVKKIIRKEEGDI